MNNLNDVISKFQMEFIQSGIETVPEEIKFIFSKNKKPNGDGENLKFFNQMPIAGITQNNEGGVTIYSFQDKYNRIIKKIAKKNNYEYRQKKIKNEFDI